MKKAIAIIQARMSSIRLPGKVLKELAGKPIIWHIYKRAEACKNVDKVIIATSNEKSDDELVNYCNQSNLNVYRGSLNNVLSRFVEILNDNDYEYFVRITGDCPLIHPNFIDSQIETLNNYDGDLIWAFPLGNLFEGQGVLSKRSIFKVYNHSESINDLEHVGSEYISNNPDKFRIVHFVIPNELIFNNIRITIDEDKDYEFIKEIYDELWEEDKIISLKDVIRYLEITHKDGNINDRVKESKINTVIKGRKASWTNIKTVGTYYYKDNLGVY